MQVHLQKLENLNLAKNVPINLMRNVLRFSFSNLHKVVYSIIFKGLVIIQILCLLTSICWTSFGRFLSRKIETLVLIVFSFYEYE